MTLPSTSKSNMALSSTAEWKRRVSNPATLCVLDHADRRFSAARPFWRRSGLPDAFYREAGLAAAGFEATEIDAL